MEGMLVGILSMLLVFVLFPLLWWRRRQIARIPHDHEDDPQPLQAERVVRPLGARRMRRRPSAASTSVASTSEEVLVQSAEEILEADYDTKASKKKEKKKQEREAQRQAEDAGRELRQKKQDRYAEMQRRKDEEREAQERLMEEEAMARRAKEEEAAVLEFEKWKGEFSVDAEGTTENEMQDDNQSLLSTFVEYITDQDLGRRIGFAKEHSCLYCLESTKKIRNNMSLSFLNSSNKYNIWLYHKCLGHPSFRVLKVMFPHFF